MCDVVFKLLIIGSQIEVMCSVTNVRGYALYEFKVYEYASSLQFDGQ